MSEANRARRALC